MSTFYKAVRPDGTDFYTGTVQWAPLDGIYPHHVQHQYSEKIEFGSGGSPYSLTCLSLSSEKTDCIGFGWPARLLAVEAPDAVHARDNKYVCLSATVVAELPAHEVFGPQGEHVIRLLDALENMTPEQADAIAQARELVNVSYADAAWEAACHASRTAARDAARAAAHAAALAATSAATWGARYSAGDAVTALVVRDLLQRERYDAATRTLRMAGITVHPDDEEL